ncbi:MAG: hypothetical protein ACHP78_20250, partial [Terriglobales bacterium]
MPVAVCYNSDSCIESIIRYAAGVSGLKRVLSLFLLSASLVFLSCGSSAPSSQPVSGLKYRALVSQDVSAGNVSAGLITVDAQLDVQAGVSPI